jgi:hypothetical protein
VSPISIAGLALLILAVVVANAPFFSERYLLIKKPREGTTKGLGFRFFELAVGYLIVLGIAILIEGRLGKVHDQAWQFYAITICLFLVLAYPGFVVRYLKK